MDGIIPLAGRKVQLPSRGDRDRGPSLELAYNFAEVDAAWSVSYNDAVSL
ncbi:MAG: hypothetical protein AB7G28_13920 [Pirellulales bacterium]